MYAGIPSGLLNTQYLGSYCNLFVMIHAPICFGCSDEEIKSIRFFIMGDDNSTFIHWPIIKVQLFVTYLHDFAESKYVMILNEKISITTDQRQNIQTLSYICNFGRPTRPIDKFITQLCHPEHGYVDKHMSVRTIGIAYASCAQDYPFYLFCKDVFHIPPICGTSYSTKNHEDKEIHTRRLLTSWRNTIFSFKTWIFHIHADSRWN